MDSRRHLLDNEGVEICVLSKCGLWRNGQVLLFIFASNRVLVAEDEVQLDNRKPCQRKMTVE
jgi:hypothetical protein